MCEPIEGHAPASRSKQEKAEVGERLEGRRYAFVDPLPEAVAGG